MPYTDRELTAVRNMLDAEMFRLKSLQHMPGRAADVRWLSEKIAELNHDRVALCAAIVHRRFEAAKDVVSFSRWVSGDGAIDSCRRMKPPVREAARSRTFTKLCEWLDRVPRAR